MNEAEQIRRKNEKQWTESCVAERRRRHTVATQGRANIRILLKQERNRGVFEQSMCILFDEPGVGCPAKQEKNNTQPNGSALLTKNTPSFFFCFCRSLHYL
jgi:hypothetical protein